MKRIGIICVLALFSIFSLQAQNNSESIDRWNSYTMRFLDDSPDSVKLNALENFKSEFKTWLSSTEAFQNPVGKLKNISLLQSPDKDWRIYTWCVKYNNGRYENFGFTQHYNKKDDYVHIAELQDNKPEFKVVETRNYGKDQWYGSVYYDMVPRSIGKKGHYVLIGFDNHNKSTKRKVIEVLSFNRMGEPIFGAAIFKTERRFFNRIVMEYNAQAQVSVRYQKDKNWILFDYIAPVSREYTNQFQFYGPTGEYDAFIIEKNILKINRGADARNPTENKGNTSKKPERKLGPRN